MTVQGPEWYSTWVTVRTDSPVFSHLTLLPHTDIGGTLTIALHLDPQLQVAAMIHFLFVVLKYYLD